MPSPPAPPIQVAIPVAAIYADPCTGMDTAMVDGCETQVVFDLDSGTWHAQMPNDGISAPLHELARGSIFRHVDLPAFPAVPAAVTPVPRFLHFVWIGHTTIPDALAQHVVLNALRTPGFRTIVHADVASTSLLDALRTRLTGQVPWITVINLREEPCFAGFASHPVYTYYQSFRGEVARNYGAACDLLRLWLIYAYGGIYLDVDDLFANEIPPEECPLAATGDLLLGANYSGPKYAFSGCCQSHFASHAGNTLLTDMLAESAVRMQASSIISSCRPWRKAGEPDSENLNAYAREVLRLTGPQLFTDLIAIHRPGLLELEADLLKAMQILHYTPEHPRYRADRYLAAAADSLAHYRPFRDGIFRVVVGAAGTWL